MRTNPRTGAEATGRRNAGLWVANCLLASIVIAGCGSTMPRALRHTNGYNEPAPGIDTMDGAPAVVVAVHGWTSDPDIWYRDGDSWWNDPGMGSALGRAVASDIESGAERGLWDQWGLDWREGAAATPWSKAMPSTVNEINAQIQGQWVAKVLSDRGTYEHVHLIGHSLGGRVVETAATMLEQVLPDATIHTTFLDAYTPYTWDRVFGSTADFADHYYNVNDWLVQMTNEEFPHALNVDISALGVPFDPAWEFGRQSWGHNSPLWFYRGTVIEPEVVRFHGYGFALAREHIDEAWPPAQEDYSTGQTYVLSDGGAPSRRAVAAGRQWPDSTFQVPLDAQMRRGSGGAVEGDSGGIVLTATPGEPTAWVAVEFETAEYTNYIELEFRWTEATGEGVLICHVDDEALWGSEPRVSLDRWVSSGKVMWTGMVMRVPTEAALPPGTHLLQLRLDRREGARLAVQVRNVRGGLLASEEQAAEVAEVVAEDAEAERAGE